jgi:cation:H+ antiporter
MAVGNVIGSNILNLLLILGLCALIKPIPIKLKEVARDYWISVLAAVALLVMVVVFNDSIPRIGSFALFAVFVAYMIILVRQALKNRNTEEDTTKSGDNSKSLFRSVCFAVLGAALIVAGGQLTVINATSIALTLGITERVIGLTVVAIGTSLPELVTSLIACKKGENAIAIGNVVGSNIFNIMFVLGLSGIIMPLTVDGGMIIDIAVLIAGSLAVLPLAFTGKRVVRFEGLVMVLMYAAYMVYIIVL